jgi:NADH/NAD ratio-sensing transcriptional regulator Rex
MGLNLKALTCKQTRLTIDERCFSHLKKQKASKINKQQLGRKAGRKAGKQVRRKHQS